MWIGERMGVAGSDRPIAGQTQRRYPLRRPKPQAPEPSAAPGGLALASAAAGLAALLAATTAGPAAAAVGDVAAAAASGGLQVPSIEDLAELITIPGAHGGTYRNQPCRGTTHWPPVAAACSWTWAHMGGRRAGLLLEVQQAWGGLVPPGGARQ